MKIQKNNKLDNLTGLYKIFDTELSQITHIINMKDNDQEICIKCKHMKNIISTDIRNMCSINTNPTTGKLLEVSNICKCGLFENREIKEYDDHWDVEFNGKLRSIKKDLIT